MDLGAGACSVTPFARVSAPASRLAARIDRRNVVPISLALVVVVGICDAVTGVEPMLTLLYVFPVALAAWFRGRSFGVAIAALSTVAQAVADRESPHVLVVAWNAIGAFGIFLVIAWLVALLHRYMQREQARLHVAVEQLRHAERLNVIGTLAAGVAHEIGTPLTVISLSAQRLVDPLLPLPRAEQLAGTIVTQAAKIGAIVRHLLEFGRRSSAQRTEVELAELARRTVELVTTAAHRYKCTIELAGAVPARVTANAAELEQVVSNLLLNAMQAMPSGGIVRVTTGTTMRRDAAGEDRGFASLSVADLGTGIAEADLPHIFDPFFTTKPAGEGTGLGLSVSYGIVSDLGGTIEVTSQRGRGSTFTMLLPLVGPAGIIDTVPAKNGS
jgi:signal transduction histidine kinase